MKFKSSNNVLNISGNFLELEIPFLNFTISKSYALPEGGKLVHYDFYRLPEPGLMMDDLWETINDGENIVVVEWGESVEELLPKERAIIKIEYTDGGRRIS